MIPLCQKKTFAFLLSVLIFTTTKAGGEQKKEQPAQPQTQKQLAQKKTTQVEKKQSASNKKKENELLLKKIKILIQEETEIRQARAKNPLTFRSGDIETIFSGYVTFAHRFYNHVTYLNEKVPDQYGYFGHIADLIFDFIYGQKKYGHKAFELYFDLRNKMRWATLNDNFIADPVELKTHDGFVSLGRHAHATSQMLVSFKDLWMQFSFNSVFSSKSKNLHFLKAGWFPFKVGRGVALSSYYDRIFEEAGNILAFGAGNTAPGITIYGELIKDKLSYDLYYAKYEDNSSSIGDIFENKLKDERYDLTDPFRGVAKDDEVWAAKLNIKPIKNPQKYGFLNVEPYIFFNEGSDQAAPYRGGMKTQLGSYGINLEYSRKNFKCSAEAAFNFGTIKIHTVDRNKIKLEDWTFVTTRSFDPATGISAIPKGPTDLQTATYLSHSHVEVTGMDHGVNENAPVTLFTTDLAKKYRHLPSNQNYPDDGTGRGVERLRNKANRVRPAYTNQLEGWMGVIDASYLLDKWNVKIATEYGYASGDRNMFEREEDKKHKGFIGLKERYDGHEVGPVFLTERLTKIPAALEPGKYENKTTFADEPTREDKYRATNQAAFTDIQYFGLAATWKPEKYKDNNFIIYPNLVFYWKAKKSHKYILDRANPDNSHVSDTQMARRFMGTEINIIANYNILKNLALWGYVAVFAPGSYYHDIKGVPMKGDPYRDIFEHDKKGLDPASYRVGTDMALFANISLTYKF